MGQYDFTYELPSNFNTRIEQLLKQLERSDLIEAFKECKYEYEIIGLAYYAGLKGDNWNKYAVDFTIEGALKRIEVLKLNDSIMKEIIGKSLKPSESGLVVKNIDYLEIIHNDSLQISRVDRLNNVILVTKDVLKDLLFIGERLCANSAFNKASTENAINDYFRDMLISRGYKEVKDQTRHGISPTGKDAGEIDILISKDGKEIALIECFKLDCINQNCIGKHIDKTINCYNPLGTAAFVIAYVSGVEFGGFCSKYFEFIENLLSNTHKIQNISELTSPNASSKVIQVILSKDDFAFPVNFLCFKLCDSV